MGKILTTVVILAIVAGLLVLAIFPVADSTTEMSENSINSIQNVEEVVTSGGDIVSAETVKNMVADPDVTVTVLDSSNVAIANVDAVPNNQSFDVVSKTFDEYDRLTAVTYRLR